jgi:hypothetical protein
VTDPNGNVVIPRGAPAQLIVVDTSNNPNDNNSKNLALALNSVNVNGRDYVVQSNTARGANEKTGGIGANKRTAKYVGGGALAGTVIGAIAVNVPAETVLNFKLDQPIYLK